MWFLCFLLRNTSVCALIDVSFHLSIHMHALLEAHLLQSSFLNLSVLYFLIPKGKVKNPGDVAVHIKLLATFLALVKGKDDLKETCSDLLIWLHYKFSM